MIGRLMHLVVEAVACGAEHELDECKDVVRIHVLRLEQRLEQRRVGAIDVDAAVAHPAGHAGGGARLEEGELLVGVQEVAALLG